MQRGSLAESMRVVGRRCRPRRDYPRPGAAWANHRDRFTLPSAPVRDLASPGPREEALRRLEAVLFLAREPLPSRKLSQYANLADATEARTLIRLLNEGYDQRGRAFRVEEVAGGFQLLTRSPFAAWLRRLEHVPAVLRLSAPALETLAVVAYRQPTPRAEIEAIRGVSCGEILRQLMERDLVRVRGRSDELGRPYLYGTTKRFLQVFGLKSLDGLPRARELKHAALAASNHPVSSGSEPDNNHEVLERSIQEDSNVTTSIDLASLDTLQEEKFGRSVSHPENQAEASEDEFDEDEEYDDEDDEEDDEEYDDYDDGEDEDGADEELDEDEDEDDEDEDDDEDDEYDDYDDEEDDEDFDDDEWEEVDDADEDEWDDDEDDEDDDWDEEDEDEEDEEEWD